VGCNLHLVRLTTVMNWSCWAGVLLLHCPCVFSVLGLSHTCITIYKNQVQQHNPCTLCFCLLQVPGAAEGQDGLAACRWQECHCCWGLQRVH
jgi:hypothetical protein